MSLDIFKIEPKRVCSIYGEDFDEIEKVAHHSDDGTYSLDSDDVLKLKGKIDDAVYLALEIEAKDGGLNFIVG